MIFKRIQCLDRAIDIISAVSGGRFSSINDIAMKVGLNQSTAYNIIKTLESRGFIACENGVYGIGARLGLLASSWDLAGNLPLLSKPILEEVNAKTGEAVCVTIMNGFQAEIVNLMPGRHQVSVQFLHRMWDYPLNLGTGRLLIALQDPSEWRKHIERHLNEAPRNWAERDWDYRSWEFHLSELRAQDFVILHIKPDSNSEEIGAVATPLRMEDGRVLAVIGSSCPYSRADSTHLVSIKDAIVAAIESHKVLC